MDKPDHPEIIAGVEPYYHDAKSGIAIYCADCRDVLPLIPDGAAEMMFTDPPYGVNYEGGHFHSGDVTIKRARESLAGDSRPDLYAQFLPLAMRAVDGPCYMWFAGSKGLAVYAALAEAGAEVHALLIWHKTNATYAAMNAQYKQRHEPCLYFKPKGSTLRWAGPTTECTVWELARDPENVFHPTQKPIELAQRAIRNHTATLVLDPFLGAGSTLIAAKDIGRSAIGIEIEERYCEIAARRLTQEVFDFGEPEKAETT